jgi:hypothetical protein
MHPLYVCTPWKPVTWGLTEEADDFPTQGAKYVEGWPSTTSAWAGWRKFDIPVNRDGGVHSLLICSSSPLGFPTCHRAS